ncbi:hypothetical protein D920_00205 [Enterococcus faecalis 13-SD-W-01]|nr:hypothetical protein D920_00205 [Enterococcus faecalis 13-SD-W-01]
MYKICSQKDVQRKAITIRLFDGSTWSNFNNGQFINQKTKKTVPLHKLYYQVRTVAASGGVVFAKRKINEQTLYYLEKPIKIKRF